MMISDGCTETQFLKVDWLFSSFLVRVSRCAFVRLFLELLRHLRRWLFGLGVLLIFGVPVAPSCHAADYRGDWQGFDTRDKLLLVVVVVNAVVVVVVVVVSVVVVWFASYVSVVVVVNVVVVNVVVVGGFVGSFAASSS